MGSWMEGLVLMMLYLIIAVSFWYYPVSGPCCPSKCPSKAVSRKQGSNAAYLVTGCNGA